MVARNRLNQDLFSGLILDLKFNEGSGDIAHDNSGYRNNGTITATTPWTADPIYLDGASDRLEIPSSPSLNSLEGTNSWTIRVRVKTSQQGANLWNQIPIITKRKTATEGASPYSFAVHLYMNADEKPQVYMSDNVQTITEVIDAVMSDGSYHDIVLVMDNGTDIFRGYFDGELNVTSGEKTGWNPNTSGAPLNIGMRRANAGGWAGQYYNGSINLIQAWNRALSVEEVKLLSRS